MDVLEVEPATRMRTVRIRAPRSALIATHPEADAAASVQILEA